MWRALNVNSRVWTCLEALGTSKGTRDGEERPLGDKKPYWVTRFGLEQGPQKREGRNERHEERICRTE